MRPALGFIVLASATILAIATTLSAPAFAEANDGPAGMWKGTVDRDGVQGPLVVRLAQKDGQWKGRADLNGSSSALTKVQVDGNHVRFTLKKQGTFDGTYSRDSLVGVFSGSKKGRPPGAITFVRQEESNEAVEAAIDAVVASGEH